MAEGLLQQHLGENILNRPPTAERVIKGIGYACLDATLDATNPFVRNQYDFDEGFYRGDFEFQSPLTGETVTSTPETYGRHRVVSALLDSTDGRGAPSTVLDLGCGTLDVARIIPEAQTGQLNLLNADISGPWSSGDGNSALERGTDKLLADARGQGNSIFNVQYDFNQSEWPFTEGSLDYIVSNMALHHIDPEQKLNMLKAMHGSLKENGAVILTDVFSKDESGARFTQAGLRGPEECGGHMVSVSEFVKMADEAGFQLDTNARTLMHESRNYQDANELTHSMNEVHATMAINKAIWFLELRK
ncbi:MAG TPA: class I SAM-dependent methyltransferase [Candidatus Saccharimonadales bacterium]|nr:class I SAM-dependent methyltransferase [Candidatus Saccharimonadales bacterium]